MYFSTFEILTIVFYKIRAIFWRDDDFFPIALIKQTLVQTLPRLSCMTDEEWIHPKMFEKAGWNDTECSLPLWNKSHKLQECTPGSWRASDLCKGCCYIIGHSCKEL